MGEAVVGAVGIGDCCEKGVDGVLDVEFDSSMVLQKKVNRLPLPYHMTDS